MEGATLGSLFGIAVGALIVGEEKGLVSEGIANNTDSDMYKNIQQRIWLKIQ